MRSLHALVVTLAWSLVGGVLGAQVPAVVPREMAGVEGDASSSVPFGLSSPVRYLCIYDSDEVTLAGPQVLAEVAWRPDWAPGQALAQKQYLVVDLRLSTSAVTAADASTTFAQNHGTDVQQVVTGTRLVLPAEPVLAQGPRAASIRMPLDRPWIWGTTPVRGVRVPAGLVVDLAITLQPAGDYRIDSPFNCDSNVVQVGTLGAACRAPGRMPLAIDASGNVKAGGTITWTVDNMGPAEPYSIVVGFTDQGPFLGGALPIDLGSLPVPAPGCFLFVAFVHANTGVADANGRGQARLGLPFDRRLVGEDLFAQAIARDLTANPLLILTSPAVRATVCGPLGCARIYHVGDAGAVTGSKTYGAAAILELR